MFERLKRLLVGAPRDIEDPKVHHRISLIAFMAWVGLGADGLSSSAYGPEETFKALGEHYYLAVVLALAMAATIFIISYAYSRIIEHFPLGGGGYVVATRLLGPRFGLLSGSALLIDYVLTISVSLAAGTDAFFSFLPPDYQPYKLAAAVGATAILTLLNLRGVKESVTVLLPVFMLFIVTHAIVILGTIGIHMSDAPAVAREVTGKFQTGLSTLGWAGMAALCLRAYSMGAGTYTGIEAVSNGLAIMREPKVETGKRTMLYMALSLALTASGIILCYLLLHARPEAGKTMNAVLIERFTAESGWFGTGAWFVITALFAEAALLFVAAQAGFIDGPRVMANMANDGWLPHRFASLSDRLTVQDGILLMSGASLATLLYTGGNTGTLVLMYAINVFITFCLTEGSMIRFWLSNRVKYPDWNRKIVIHVMGFTLCFSILVVNTYEKFGEGGWVTLVATSALVALCYYIKHHYGKVQNNLKRLDEILVELPQEPEPAPAVKLDKKAPTAVLLVGAYRGLGVHCLLAVQRLFPTYFKNFIFVSVGVVDSVTFHGVEAVDEVRERTEAALKKYVELARGWGLAADYRLALGVDVVDEAEQLCHQIVKDYPRCIVFAGKLVFEREGWSQRLLHNETAFQLQRRLQFSGLNSMVLPVRVMAPAK